MFTWFSGFRMRFFAEQRLRRTSATCGPRSESNYSDAFKVGSTGDDDKQYFIPIYNYPWAVFYRKSMFADKGYTIPTTLDEFKTLATKMQADGLIPMAFGDSDGWPAMGTFDIINLRQNGYDFHVGLMKGDEKWTDPKTKAAFETWKTLLPFYQEGAAGRTWQDAAQALVQKKAGMYLLGMFVSQQFQEAGEADLADLDFFPYPNFGTQYDAEKALDAPIDGFMISANSPTLAADLDAAKAFLEYLGQGRTQVLGVHEQGQHRGGQEPTPAGTPTSRRRPPSSSVVPSGSPSSWTATPTRTSRARTACRPSCSTSSPARMHAPSSSRPSRTSGDSPLS